jgi:hypothetical protein
VKQGAEGEVAHPTRNHTLRYEEAALAFDDRPPFDAPTFEAHALPIEATADAATDGASPVVEPEGALPPDLPGALRRPFWRRRARGAVLVLAVLAGLGLLAAGAVGLLR